MTGVVKSLILDLFVREDSKYLTIKETIQAFIETELPVVLGTLLDKDAPSDVIIALDKVSLDVAFYTDIDPNSSFNQGCTQNFKTSIIHDLQAKIKLEIDKSISDPQKKKYISIADCNTNRN